MDTWCYNDIPDPMLGVHYITLASYLCKITPLSRYDHRMRTPLSCYIYLCNRTSLSIPYRRLPRSYYMCHWRIPLSYSIFSIREHLNPVENASYTFMFRALGSHCGYLNWMPWANLYLWPGSYPQFLCKGITSTSYYNCILNRIRTPWVYQLNYPLTLHHLTHDEQSRVTSSHHPKNLALKINPRF